MTGRASFRVKPTSLIVGTMGVDVISNARRKRVRVGGGAALSAAIASSHLARTAVVSSIGKNFPGVDLNALKKRVDITGLAIDRKRKCNKWVATYPDMDHAETIRYQKNIPQTSFDIPEQLKDSACVYISGIHPSAQLQVVSQLKNPSVVMMDTLGAYAKNEPDMVRQAFSRADVVSINIDEATLLCGTQDAYLALDKLLALGPKVAIIKMGSNGAIMGTKNLLFQMPSLNGDPVDTTGAGDSFGGAFIGYLARQLGTRHFLDNIAFGEAFLMASAMASFDVEDFGPRRLYALTPEELTARSLIAKAKLTSPMATEVKGKLSGALLLDVFGEPSAMKGETLKTIVSEGYFPGTYSLDQVKGSYELPGTRQAQKHIVAAIVKNSEQTPEAEFIKRYMGEITHLDLSRVSYFNVAESLMTLGRIVFDHDRESKRMYTFSAENKKAYNGVVDIAREVREDISVRDWLVILSAANAVEVYSLKSKYDAIFEELKETVKDPSARKLALDASTLFETRVFSKPTKIAYFTDNHGEAEIDLKFILALAKKYDSMDPSGNWSIGIVPKALPTLTDATYDSIMSSINAEGSPVAALKGYISSGKVRILNGGPKTQGTIFPHLSQEVGDFLVDVKRSGGVLIGKGEANACTLSGLEIDTFVIFKAKSQQVTIAAGVERNGLVSVYIPAGIQSIVGHATGVKQNLADLSNAVQSEKFKAVPLDKVKERVNRTGETFMDALRNFDSPSEPAFKGEKIPGYVLPLINDPAIKGYLPIFIARASMPYKIAWDLLAGAKKDVRKSHPFMPKVGVLTRYPLSGMILQMLTREKIGKRVSSKTFKKLSAAFASLPSGLCSRIEDKLGCRFSEAEGRTLGELVKALANVGIDERYDKAMELYREVEADDKKVRKDRDPNLRQGMREFYAHMKGNTDHATRGILNILLADTAFGRTIRSDRILFLDEVGGTGNTVIAAEFIMRAFYDSAKWKFYTVQPAKDTTGLFEGDCGIRFKPEEDNPKTYDLLFVKTPTGDQEDTGLGLRYSYRDAMDMLSQGLVAGIGYGDKVAAFNSRVGEIMKQHQSDVFAGIIRLNSLHGLEVLKMILRAKHLSAVPADKRLHLASRVAEAVVKEERVPNHTLYRYDIRAEITLLQDRISKLLNADPELCRELLDLDKEIAIYDTVQTLKLWQRGFDTYRGDIERGAKDLN